MAERSIPRWLRHALRGILQLCCDAAAVALSYRLAYAVRFQWEWWLERFPISGIDPGWAGYGRLLYALIPLWLGIFWYSARLYTLPWRGAADRFLFILQGAVIGTLVTLSATFIYGRLEYSRQILLSAVPLIVALVSLSEAFVLWLDARIARFESTSPLLLFGGGKVAEALRENLRARHPGIAIHSADSVPAPQEVVRRASALGASEVVLLRGGLERSLLLELADACDGADLQLKVIPDILELRFGEVQLDDALGLPAYRVQHTSLSPSNYAIKRITDLLLVLAVLVAAGIPFLLIALLVRLDSAGPAFYRQKRLGYKGRMFEAYKFRTMVAGAETGVAALKSARNDQRGGFFKAKEDPRVTRFGRWLRRFSLDELPQFINVFLGDMSVVGPRPLAVATGEMEELGREFGPTAKKRLNILPGITGLWQVSGRSDVSGQERFALDLFYVEHWSLGLDLLILLKTVPAMLSAKGAY